MNQRIYAITSLARPLDLKNWSNALILVLTPIAGVGGFIYWSVTDNNLALSLQFGLWMAVSTMLAWALVRELAPDHPLAAFVGVGFSWVGLAISSAALTTSAPAGAGTVAITLQNIPPIDWIALGALIAYSRLVNRIVGPPPRLVDSVIVLTATLALILFDHWLLISIGVAAFLIDALVLPRLTRHFIFAGLALVILVARVIIVPVELPAWNLTTTPVLFTILAISVFYVAAIVATNNVDSHPDIRELLTDDDPTNDPTPEQYELSVLRIRLTMILALGAGLLSYLWNGDFGVRWLIPLWAAMAAVAIVTLPTIIWRRIRKPRKSNTKVTKANSESSTTPNTTTSASNTNNDEAGAAQTTLDGEISS